MSYGHYKLKSKINLDEINENTLIPSSDFATVSPKGNLVQLEYVPSKTQEIEPYIVNPGIWSIQKTMNGLVLEKTEFIKDKILDNFINTKLVTDKIDCFFKRFNIYYEYGYEVPKRACLLYGPAGTGKSSCITKIAETYVKDGKTAIVIWGTDKIDPHDVKEFFKSFEYVGVEKIILVAEDIGGVEIDQTRIKSQSSLLALLDNQEKSFKIPTQIIATTNFPENFLGNLTNRPQRFDDKIKIDYPQKEARQELFKFFCKTPPTEEELNEIGNNKYKEFTPAHLKEVVIRAALYDLTLKDSMSIIQQEIEHYKKAFSEKSRLGISAYNSDDFDE